MQNVNYLLSCVEISILLIVHSNVVSVASPCVRMHRYLVHQASGDHSVVNKSRRYGTSDKIFHESFHINVFACPLDK